MMSASVSVVLPYRDSEQTIDECIQSVQAQRLQDWELLAVNDHSSDNSESILRGYADKDDRIKALQTTGKGIVSALNHGIRHSTTPLIARMDADDRMLPERLRAAGRFHGEEPSYGPCFMQGRIFLLLVKRHAWLRKLRRLDKQTRFSSGNIT